MSRNAPTTQAIGPPQLTRPSRWPAAGLAGLLAFAAIVGLWMARGDSRPSANAAASRARVVIVQDVHATVAFAPRADVVKAMVDRGLTNLTGLATVAAAWRSLVQTQDVVGIKVYAPPGPTSGTRPEVVAAVVEGLLAAGQPPRNIIIWDKHEVDLRDAGYYDLAMRLGVRAASSAGAGFDDQVVFERPLVGQLNWGDSEFGRKGEGVGRKSFVSKLVSRELTKIINISPLLNHHRAGVAGNLYSLAFGSVDNALRFELDESLLAEAVPDIYNMPLLGERVVLNITDALICQYQGSHRSLLHYSTPLNQLRFSHDPVALDVLSLQELMRQREGGVAVTLTNLPAFELYQNASLIELGTSDPKLIEIETLK